MVVWDSRHDIFAEQEEIFKQGAATSGGRAADPGTENTECGAKLEETGLGEEHETPRSSRLQGRSRGLL